MVGFSHFNRSQVTFKSEMDHFRVLTPLGSDQPPNPGKINMPTLRRWPNPSRVKVHHYKVEVMG